MQEIIEREHGSAAEGVSTERIIILTIKSPYVPSIDMVDLPGLVMAPESMKQGTRQVVEDHVQRHGQYSIYLATVAATLAPNQSPAMEIVQSHELEGRTIGVLTKCDHAMAIADEREVLVERLQAAPPAGCGAVRLDPHGWVCVMNAPTQAQAVSESQAGCSFARLKQQALEEEAFMRDKMAGVVDAELAGCRALVKLINQVFVLFLVGTWAPKTMRLLDEAVEKAEGENARMGLPEFDEEGGGDDGAERARDLAVKEAVRKMESGTAGLVQGCWRDVLEPLKRTLVGITGESICNAEASRVPARWRAQRERFEAACVEGVAGWRRYWAGKVRHVLQGGDDDDVGGAGFVLGRFPALIDAVVDSVERSAEQQGERLVQVLKELGDGYYGRMSPWVQMTTMFEEQAGAGGGATLRMTLKCDHMALVEKVMYGFVEHSTCGILDDVKNKLVHVARSIPDVAWIEACADERKRLRARIRHLTHAKAQILTVLGVESEDALVALAAAHAPPPHASHAVSSRPRRVVRGDCERVSYAGFSGDIRGVAVSKEGHLYVADQGNKRIEVLSGEGPNGTHIKTLCAGQLLGPNGIALDDDDTLFVADYNAKAVKVFDKEGRHVRDIGSGRLTSPRDVALDAQGHVYVADRSSHVVSIFDKQGQFVRDIGLRGSGGSAPGQLHYPQGLALDGDGNVYIFEYGSHTVSVFDKHGTFIRSIGQGHLSRPFGVAVCPSGRVYVASNDNNQVVVFDKTGTHVRSIPANKPAYVCVDDKGQVCVTEQTQKRVLVIRAHG